MVTLKEIEAAEAANRNGLWKRDKLVEGQARIRTRIAGLEEKLAVPDTGAQTLEKILELLSGVPADIVTRGNPPFSPGGFIARDELSRISTAALADLVRKRNALAESLAQAQQELAELERAWSLFVEANPEIVAA